MSSWGREKGHLELTVSNFLGVTWSSGEQPPEGQGKGGTCTGLTRALGACVCAYDTDVASFVVSSSVPPTLAAARRRRRPAGVAKLGKGGGRILPDCELERYSQLCARIGCEMCFC